MASNRCRSATTVGITSRDRSQCANRVVSSSTMASARDKFGTALGEVVLHDLLQIVDVVDEHLFQVARRRLDVARNRDVDDEQRTVRPLAHDVLHQFAGDDDRRGAGCRHRDIRVGETDGELAPRNSFTAEIGGERSAAAGVRLAMTMRSASCALKWMPVSAAISPAPAMNTVRPFIVPKIFRRARPPRSSPTPRRRPILFRSARVCRCRRRHGTAG